MEHSVDHFVLHRVMQFVSGYILYIDKTLHFHAFFQDVFYADRKCYLLVNNMTHFFEYHPLLAFKYLLNIPSAHDVNRLRNIYLLFLLFCSRSGFKFLKLFTLHRLDFIIMINRLLVLFLLDQLFLDFRLLFSLLLLAYESLKDSFNLHHLALSPVLNCPLR